MQKYTASNFPPWSLLILFPSSLHSDIPHYHCASFSSLYIVTSHLHPSLRFTILVWLHHPHWCLPDILLTIRGVLTHKYLHTIAPEEISSGHLRSLPIFQLWLIVNEMVCEHRKDYGDTWDQMSLPRSKWHVATQYVNVGLLPSSSSLFFPLPSFDI